MCSRYSFSDNLDELVRVLRVETIPLERRYNVAPLSSGPVVVQRPGELPRIELMQWGLVPWWARDASGAAEMSTAPAETVAERAALRSGYHQRRCLVIADGFYQWGGSHEPRQPWRFTLNGGGASLMLLAGIWESWRPLGAPAPLYTYSILTTTANAAVAGVHDRMPVILEEKNWSLWLNPTTPPDTLAALLRPWPHSLTVFPATPRLEDPLFQGKECHEPHLPTRHDHTC
ncbi:MAG TPA: SOS response-associated peptidase [Prosthecobacter sp.]|nr:SOS response-associated peptidase [Prosthecobacter sp.]